MSVPDCAGADGPGGVSVAEMPVCNVDNIGSSISAPGFSFTTFAGVTVAGATTNAGSCVVSVAVITLCNMDNIGSSISSLDCTGIVRVGGTIGDSGNVRIFCNADNIGSNIFSSDCLSATPFDVPVSFCNFVSKPLIMSFKLFIPFSNSAVRLSYSGNFVSSFSFLDFSMLSITCESRAILSS